jgi:hypothetical protein
VAPASRSEPGSTQRLPFIDEHCREIDARSEQVWAALTATLGGWPNPPRWLAVTWGLQYPSRAGAWDPSVAAGDTLPGFIATEVEPLQRLTLRGSHRFSDYGLSFLLEHLADGGTRLRAKSSAAFPGVKGRVYRAVVIGTRGHRIAVGLILSQIASRAENWHEHA